MLSLLMTHRYDADLPAGITPRDAYNALLRRWNGSSVPYVSAAGHVHLEFWEDPELAKYYPENADADDGGAPPSKKKKSAKTAKSAPAKSARPRKRGEDAV
jgi:hypothetical protein